MMTAASTCLLVSKARQAAMFAASVHLSGDSFDHWLRSVRLLVRTDVMECHGVGFCFIDPLSRALP